MNARVTELRERSLATRPSISAERSLILTRFYREHLGRHSTPVLRALAFRELCERKTITIEPGELIVGERGPAPKATPLFPELTCHSTDDLRILDTRPLTSYDVPADVIAAYEDEVIPYWRGRSLRDRLFEILPPEWHDAYEAGLFTEFMEQRAPGHTVADGKIYARGMEGFTADIDAAAAAVEVGVDPRAGRRLEELRAMRIAADAAVRFAERHAELAEAMAAEEPDAARRAELARIADVCRRVPAHAPRDFWEAVQMYWFCHLAVITELNGWDAYSPGHLDQHLEPFYQRGIADGTLTREGAKELLGCLFVKFNNHPAPPKVGVTAAESGTYTDFAGIALGGIRRDGTDGVGEVSYLLLEVIDELHLVQPSPNVQLVAGHPGALPARDLPRGAQGLRLPGPVQRGRGRDPAAAQGQERRGRPRGRHQRLRGDRRLRQGGVRPHRLLQPAQDPGARTARRPRSPDGPAAGAAHRRSAGLLHLRRPVRGLDGASSATSSTSRSAATPSSRASTPTRCPPRSCRSSPATASRRGWTTTRVAPATTPPTSRAWASAP